MYDVVNYDELNVEAKLNCLAGYVYNICPYEDFGDLKSIEELEYGYRIGILEIVWLYIG